MAESIKMIHKTGPIKGFSPMNAVIFSVYVPKGNLEIKIKVVKCQKLKSPECSHL